MIIHYFNVIFKNYIVGQYESYTEALSDFIKRFLSFKSMHVLFE